MLLRFWQKRILTCGVILGFALTLFCHPLLVRPSTAQQAWSLTSPARDMVIANLTSIEQWKMQGRSLNQQGSEAFRKGQHREALHHWEATADAYENAHDPIGSYQAQLNQTQALEELGFYRRSLAKLEQIVQQLQSVSEQSIADLAQLDAQTVSSIANQIPRLQMIALQRQGELLRRMGEFEQAQKLLEEGIAIAQSSQQTSSTAAEVGKLLFSLGNTAQAQGQTQTAIEQYKQAQTYDLGPQSQAQLGLAMMQAYLQDQNEAAAAQLWPGLQNSIAQLPDSHGKVYSQIKLARCLLTLQQQAPNLAAPTFELTKLLQTAVQVARQLGDIPAQSYALGSLGQIYEQQNAWPEAQRWTQEAIALAEFHQAPELLYQWYWQQGRVLQAQGKSDLAIASLRQSVQFLQSLRSDLVAAGSETQFSFRSDIEPLYRDLVGLLLQHTAPNSSPKANSPHPPERLAEAISVIDSLQQAELEDFLQKACDQTQTAQVSEIDPEAAVIYPIILDDRLEILLQLPEQPLQQFTIPVTQNEFQTVLSRYRRTLTIRSRRSFKQPAQQLYQWLITPLETSLQQSQIKTLVFVSDSSLNTVPIAALHDGKHFLLEDYRIATTPSLKLLGPKPLKTHQLSALAAGISQGQNGFSRLTYVTDELSSIRATFPESSILLDNAFTTDSLQSKLQSLTAPIVHLATHGQFSSNADQTFILAWDRTIPLALFDQILRQASQQIELLVLSACQTAVGDSKAALGITGVAIDAGAQSTVATLWSVDDLASSMLMQAFYTRLSQPEMTRAEALRQAQIGILQTKGYTHPFYWAPFTMVGNWL